MAAKAGSGIAKPKRRAWGKQRCKRDLVSIDHMDIAVLTKVAEHGNSETYAITDLQNPESMATNTLLYHLSRMKIIRPGSGRSRNDLLCQFSVHICPKPQRSTFWRRKRRHENFVEEWTESDMDCDMPAKKREHTGDDSDAPAAKRKEIEGTSVTPTLPTALHAGNQNTPENTPNKRIIKIRRKSDLICNETT